MAIVRVYRNITTRRLSAYCPNDSGRGSLTLHGEGILGLIDAMQEPSFRKRIKNRPDILPGLPSDTETNCYRDLAKLKLSEVKVIRDRFFPVL